MSHRSVGLLLVFSLSLLTHCFQSKKNPESQIPSRDSQAPPEVTVTSPRADSGGNSIRSYISITFSEGMEQGTLGDPALLGGPEGTVTVFQTLYSETEFAESCPASVGDSNCRSQLAAQLGIGVGDLSFPLDLTAYTDTISLLDLYGNLGWESFPVSIPMEEDSVNWSGPTVIMKPGSLLAYGRKYQVRVSDTLADTTGDTLTEPYFFYFTTAADPESGAPSVVRETIAETNTTSAGQYDAVFPREAENKNPPVSAGYWADSIPSTVTFIIRFTKQMDTANTEEAISLEKCLDGPGCANRETGPALTPIWTGNALNLKVTTPLDQSTQLSGTVDITSGTNTVTGSGTNFEEDLTAGDPVTIDGETLNVQSVDSATQLTLTGNHGAGASGADIHLARATYRLAISEEATDSSLQQLDQARAYIYGVASFSEADPDFRDDGDQSDADPTDDEPDNGRRECYDISTWLCLSGGSGSGACGTAKTEDRSFHSTGQGNAPDEDWYCFKHDGVERTIRLGTTLPGSSAAFTRLDVYSSTSGKTALDATLTPEYLDSYENSAGQESEYQFTLSTGGSKWYYVKLTERFGGAPYGYTFSFTDFGGEGAPPQLDQVSSISGTDPEVVLPANTDITDYSFAGDPGLKVDSELIFDFSTTTGAEMNWDSVRNSFAVTDYLGNEVAGSFEIDVADEKLTFRPDSNFTYRGADMAPRIQSYLVVDAPNTTTINLQGGNEPIPLNTYIRVEGGYEGYVVSSTINTSTGTTGQIQVYPAMTTGASGNQPEANALVTEKFGGIYLVHLDTSSATDTFNHTVATSGSPAAEVSAGTFMFLTENQKDYIRPAVVGHSPEQTTDNPRNVTVSLTFSEEIQAPGGGGPPTIAHMRLYDCGPIASANCDSGGSYVEPGGTVVAYAQDESMQDIKNVIQINFPASTLCGSQSPNDLICGTHRFRLSMAAAGVEDLAGNQPSQDFSFDFETNDVNDVIRPTIISGGGTFIFTPYNQNDIPVTGFVTSIQFDEPMNQSSVASALSVVHNGSGSVVPFDIQVHPSLTDGFEITIPASGNLLYDAGYTLSMTNSATDLAGNLLQSGASENFTVESITPDTSYPELNSVTLAGNTSGSGTLAWAHNNRTFSAQVVVHDDNATAASGINGVRTWLYRYKSDDTLDTSEEIYFVADAGNPVSGSDPANFDLAGQRVYHDWQFGRYAIGLIEIRDQGDSWPDGNPALYRTYRLNQGDSTVYEYCDDTASACLSGGSWTASAVSAVFLDIEGTDPDAPEVTTVEICADEICSSPLSPGDNLTALTQYYISVAASDPDDASPADSPTGISSAVAYLLPGDPFHYSRRAALPIPLEWEATSSRYVGVFRPRNQNYSGRWSVVRVDVEDGAGEECTANCDDGDTGNDTLEFTRDNNNANLFSLENGNSATYQILNDSGYPTEYTGALPVAYGNFVTGTGPGDRALLGTDGSLDSEFKDETGTALSGGVLDMTGQNFQTVQIALTPPTANAPTDCATAPATQYCIAHFFVAPHVASDSVHTNELMTASSHRAGLYTGGQYKASFQVRDTQANGFMDLARIVIMNYNPVDGATKGNLVTYIWDGYRGTSSSAQPGEQYKLLKADGTYYTSGNNGPDVVDFEIQNNPSNNSLVTAWDATGSVTSLDSGAQITVNITTGDSAPGPDTAAGDYQNMAVAWLAPPAEAANFFDAWQPVTNGSAYENSAGTWEYLKLELYRDSAGNFTGTANLDGNYPEGDYRLAALITGSGFDGMLYYTSDSADGGNTPDRVLRLPGAGGTPGNMTSAISLNPLNTGNYTNGNGELTIDTAEITSSTTGPNLSAADIEFTLTNGSANPLLSATSITTTVTGTGSGGTLGAIGTPQAATIDIFSTFTGVQTGDVLELSASFDFDLEHSDGRIYQLTYDPASVGDYYNCSRAPTLALSTVPCAAAVTSSVDATALSHTVP